MKSIKNNFLLSTFKNVCLRTPRKYLYTYTSFIQYLKFKQNLYTFFAICTCTGNIILYKIYITVIIL